MIEAAFTFIVISALIAYVYRRYDPLKKFEPISEHEMLLLAQVDDRFYADMLDYVRNLRMSPSLQNYLSDKKEVLESISAYMMLQVATKEVEKKETWEIERAQKKSPRVLTHNERMILNRLQRDKNE